MKKLILGILMIFLNLANITPSYCQQKIYVEQIYNFTNIVMGISSNTTTNIVYPTFLVKNLNQGNGILLTNIDGTWTISTNGIGGGSSPFDITSYSNFVNQTFVSNSVYNNGTNILRNDYTNLINQATNTLRINIGQNFVSNSVYTNGLTNIYIRLDNIDTNMFATTNRLIELIDGISNYVDQTFVSNNIFTNELTNVYIRIDSINTNMFVTTNTFINATNDIRNDYTNIINSSTNALRIDVGQTFVSNSVYTNGLTNIYNQLLSINGTNLNDNTVGSNKFTSATRQWIDSKGGGDTSQWATNSATTNVNMNRFGITNVSNLVVSQLVVTGEAYLPGPFIFDEIAVSGNIAASNITSLGSVTASNFIGDGSRLSNIQGTNGIYPGMFLPYPITSATSVVVNVANGNVQSLEVTNPSCVINLSAVYTNYAQSVTLHLVCGTNRVTFNAAISNVTASLTNSTRTTSIKFEQFYKQLFWWATGT